jgi:hypothetical protein
MKTITPIITYFAANSTIPYKFLKHHQANSIDLPVAHDIDRYRKPCDDSSNKRTFLVKVNSRYI